MPVPPPASPLRNDAIAAALTRALASKDRYVFALLIRGGNLPGPRPNAELAAAFGEALVMQGAPADRLVTELASVDERQAAGTSSEAFLPYVAAHAYAAYIAHGRAVKAAWLGLHELAGDTRKIVRDGVVASLTRMALTRAEAGDAFVHEAASWTDGFLHAAVVVETLADRALLERVRDVAALEERLDEAVSLAERATRSSERSQGRRRLLEVLETSIPPLVIRHGPLLDWLVRRAATLQPELRTAFEAASYELGRKGAPTHIVDAFRRALDAAAPLKRDPTDYRGPTRGRGRKAEGRSQRR